MQQNSISIETAYQPDQMMPAPTRSLETGQKYRGNKRHKDNQKKKTQEHLIPGVQTNYEFFTQLREAVMSVREAVMSVREEIPPPDFPARLFQAAHHLRLPADLEPADKLSCHSSSSGAVSCFSGILVSRKAAWQLCWSPQFRARSHLPASQPSRQLPSGRASLQYPFLCAPRRLRAWRCSRGMWPVSGRNGPQVYRL